MTKNEAETGDLQARVRLLTHNSEGYLRTREIFLEHNSSISIRLPGRIVRGSNEAVYAGDAIADAYVYTCG